MENKRMRGMRGQVAFEFLIIYVIFMVIFITAVYYSGQRAVYQQYYAQQVYAREIGVRFAQEINTAARFPGYEKNYTFSNTIKGSSYMLNVSEGVLMLSYGENAMFFYPLMTSNISINGFDTSVIPAEINTSIGHMILKNIKGRVVVTQ